MRRLLLLGALMISALPAASGKPGKPSEPRYDDRSLQLDLRLPQRTDKALRARVRQVTKGKLAGVERRAPDGSTASVKLGDLETPELMAVLVAVLFDLRGSENDLLIKDFRARPVPVSVWWDAPKVLTVQAGEPIRRGTEPATTPAAVEARFDVLRLVDGDRQWEPETLSLVDEALSRLTPAEREKLRGVPFHRKRRPHRDLVQALKAVPAAAYVYDERGPRLEIFDAAVDVGNRFSGSPDDPHRYSLHVLLHEIGHAIALDGRRAERQRIEALIEEHRSMLALNTAWYERLERARKRLRTRADGQAYSRDLAAFNAQRDEANALVRRIEADAARLREQNRGATPAAVELKRVLGRDGAPTYYGQTSPDEGFADTFALFHGDPEALRRSRPKALAWFAAGGHLQGTGRD